jgi:hypothetical protein
MTLASDMLHHERCAQNQKGPTHCLGDICPEVSFVASLNQALQRRKGFVHMNEDAINGQKSFKTTLMALCLNLDMEFSKVQLMFIIIRGSSPNKQTHIIPTCLGIKR